MSRGYIGRLVSPKEASRKWRERNPDKVRAANSKPRNRKHDPIKSKLWRMKRLADPSYRIRMNRQANDRASMLRRWLDAYKIRKGCSDCGYKFHPAALHFDHRGDKKMNVCNSKSISQAKLEISKCDVRCVNCHAEKTFVLHPCKPDIFRETYDRVE